MVAQWGLSFLSRQIPELESEPIRIGFHIAAEMVTAILLLIGGTGLLAGAPWSRDISLLGMGMLFYTAIVSPGYFAQKGQWGWLGVFAAIIILGLVSIRLMW
jgi:hypothetical protein